jgi:hypothetical protein
LNVNSISVALPQLLCKTQQQPLPLQQSDLADDMDKSFEALLAAIRNTDLPGRILQCVRIGQRLISDIVATSAITIQGTLCKIEIRETTAYSHFNISKASCQIK